jgi:CRISPR-associated protein Csd1
MILQSLAQLFDRIQAEDGNPYGVPIPGYSVQNITFRIILNPDGSLVDIQDAREPKPQITKSGQTKVQMVPSQTLLPDLGGRSRNTKANFLYDKLSYLTGYDKDPDRSALAKEHFDASKSRHLEWREAIPHPEYHAVCAFFETFKKDDHLEQLEGITKLIPNPVGVFRVLPSHKDVHELSEILKFWSGHGDAIKGEGADKVEGQCLVTGRFTSIARLHEPKLKGFGKDSPLLVSFNDNAYTSYGKDQSYNAPVSEAAVFAYCNALNALLSGPQSYRHRVTIGDATTLFWTEKKSKTESLFAQILNGNIESESETTTTEDQTQHRQLEALLNILRKGGGASLAKLDDDPDTKFYLLGLGKMNKSRVAVRFWHVSTIGQMLENLHDHFQSLSIACKTDRHPFWEPEFPSAQRLLEETARARDRKAIAPLLGGQLMQAILHRTPYPMTLLQGVLNRIRANDPVDYLKAAILKSILIRNFNQNIPTMLDTTIKQTSYLLGRLFAAMEQSQRQAHEFKLERTIRETFFSGAAATPASIFPRIHKLHIHHLRKIGHGSQKFFEDLIGEILAKLAKNKAGEIAYPKTLTLEEQGGFAIGYYHQIEAFKKNKETPEPAASTDS